MEGFKSDENSRAEDILLGALGYGENAIIDSIEPTYSSCKGRGYKGRGHFSDGEKFFFENADELSDLERWALGILVRYLERTSK